MAQGRLSLLRHGDELLARDVRDTSPRTQSGQPTEVFDLLAFGTDGLLWRSRRDQRAEGRIGDNASVDNHARELKDARRTRSPGGRAENRRNGAVNCEVDAEVQAEARKLPAGKTLPELIRNDGTQSSSAKAWWKRRTIGSEQEALACYQAGREREGRDGRGAVEDVPEGRLARGAAQGPLRAGASPGSFALWWTCA